MPQRGVSVHRDEAVRDQRSDASGPARVGGAGVPGRRTVTIRGQGAERGGVGASANGSARRRQPRPYERSGFRPDRVAMWAVLLGVMLIVVAATSSHAAVPSVHHAAAAHAVAALGLALH